MSPENDQTRWIGVRPTNPPEEFLTTTEKRDPAISDLQAVKDNYTYRQNFGPMNCVVSSSNSLAVVPADEFWVLTNVSVRNITSLCDMQFRTNLGGNIREFKTFYSIPAGEWVDWNGHIYLSPTDRLQVQWILGGAADNATVTASGYIIGVY